MRTRATSATSAAWAGSTGSRHWMAIGFGSVPTQDLFQRSMSARNESTAVWGTYLAGALYLFFGIMSPLIGIMMFTLSPGLENTDFVLITAAIEYMPPILTAVFLAALASALMSTADSSLLAGASVVTQNVLPLLGTAARTPPAGQVDPRHGRRQCAGRRGDRDDRIHDLRARRGRLVAAAGRPVLPVRPGDVLETDEPVGGGGGHRRRLPHVGGS